MKRLLWFMLGIGGVLLYFAYPVQAALITVDFTANVIGNGSDPIPSPPTTPVTGTIVYQADSVTSDITSLTSINLTIDGHSYTIGELTFFNNPIGSTVERYIGGTIGGVGGVPPGDNDFFLRWFSPNLLPSAFRYTSDNYSDHSFGTINGSDFTSFSVRESSASASVPEPSTMILLSSGLAGLVGYGRRRFKK